MAGGTIGGIIGSSSADVATRRVYVGTAAGEDPLRPRQPTMHALDMDTGEVVWQSRSSDFLTRDWTAGPTTGVNDVAFFGSATTATLRGMRSADGTELFMRPVATGISAIASPPVVVDGTLVVGTGIGSLTGEAGSLSDMTAALASDIVALCVPGSPDCPDDRGVELELRGAHRSLLDDAVAGDLEVEPGLLGPRVRVAGTFVHNGDPVVIDVTCLLSCGGSLRVGSTRIPIRLAALRDWGQMPDMARFSGTWTDTSTLPWSTTTFDVTVRES
ncbi:MAG: PQQ-like beta-propeller repeat protein [Acidimicrobiia bacterium]|nr:PQQ-like beta-propeller repeat protein [Acidimicrobiia bacterium]